MNLVSEIVKVNCDRVHKVEVDTCPVSYDVKVLTETIVRRDAVEYYKGPYQAVPETEPVRLETKDKFLTQDITIFKIPYWETENQNGTTVYIGGGENNGI